MTMIPNEGSENVPFLKPDEITDGVEIIFDSEGKLVSDMWGDNRLQIDVILPNDELRRITVNKTSQNNLIPVYGKDTSSWIGLKARIGKIKQLVAGRLKTIIIVYPVA